MALDYEGTLRTLLSEPHEAARQRTASSFDKKAGEASAIILCGAGNVGRKLARTMGGEYAGRLYFADRIPALHGTLIDGTEVLSPQDAAARFGATGLFVITAFNREEHSDYRDVQAAYRNLGAVRIIPYPVAAWKYGGILLPHYAQGTPADVLPHAEDILKVSELFRDERSRELFLEMARVSLQADYESFSNIDRSKQYLTPEVLSALPATVGVADCGAYDGDTLRDFLEMAGADRIREWHALEPDPVNFGALKQFVATLPMDLQNRIFCHHAAAGRENGFIRIDVSGTEASSLCGENEGVQVPCYRLDDLFAASGCDFIKMDIEGAEIDALAGAENCLKQSTPVLALSIYHKPTDFFSIPLHLMESSGGGALSLRLARYGSYFYETVLLRC